MKQREYHIKIHSISRFIIAMIVIFISSLILINNYTPRFENEFLAILQFLAVLVTSFYLASLIGMAKASVIFTDEAIVHKWKRRFLLSWERDVKIPWNIVDNYVFQEDRTFDSFIINLTNKTRYKIDKLNVFPIKDDFKKLTKNFPKLSNEYRKAIESDTETRTIKEGESIYAKKSFKWMFYALLTGFLILAFSKVIDPDTGTTWSALGVIGSGLSFYGFMILGQKKKK